ncbi:MAG: TFIIB-type zinc ribbon-containing protein [Anaerorhabdus sp.]
MQETKENEVTAQEKNTVINVNPNAINGQDKCPSCGSTDISLNPATGLLRCNFCRHELPADLVQDLDLAGLEGDNTGMGAQDINGDAQDTMITLKCTSCGAEVVVDTKESAQARCHWCRNYLSINEQIPNGATPDAVLPFKITKEEAKEAIEKFVGKRTFYALPKFKKEFKSENILGVYFPYLLVDIRAQAKFSGEAEKLIRQYFVRSGKHTVTYYDADLYKVSRNFEILVDDLAIEASKDKLSYTATKTNNIINSIMPFDTENCVHWNANYLRGFTSEKRDINKASVQDTVSLQLEDVARFGINSTLAQYNRGVRWSTVSVDLVGQQWKATYLPVWLYSYQQEKMSGQMIHYLALNARTKEVMGSVPLNTFRLFMVSASLEALSVFFWWIYLIDQDAGWIVMTIGFIYYALIYARYRNSNVRHYHEKETKKEVKDVQGEDHFLSHRYRLRSSKIQGANNHDVKGASGKRGLSTQILESLDGQNDDGQPFLP